MGRKNCIKFEPATIKSDGTRKTTCEMDFSFRNFSNLEKVHKLVDMLIYGCHAEGFVAKEKEDVYSEKLGTELAKLSAENVIREYAVKKLHETLGELNKLSDDISRELLKLSKTYQHEEIYIAKLSGKDVIGLYNRYGNELALIKDNNHYRLVGDYYYCSITRDGSNIRSIDPEGGPMLSVGSHIPGTDKTITKITRGQNEFKIYAE